DGMAPGDGGRTSLKLPDPLGTGRSYYWRARAEDGANTGSFSSASTFAVYTPVVIQAPGLISPINNVTIDNLHPRFTISNAPRTGPAGTITYSIELADSSSFGNILAAWNVAEQPDTSKLDSPQDLAYSKQYFWRARAVDSLGNVGPLSSAQSFQTLT